MRTSPDRPPADVRSLYCYKWKGADAIGLAQQLNEQFIELFCELCFDAQCGNPFPLVATHRDLWGRLDPISRKRLALFPFVIVDLRFGDAAWWRMAARNGAQARISADGATPVTRWEWLALETLMFAWQVAREDRGVALMIFGMPPLVAECIATLTMQQVRTFAVECAKRLRIRWDDDPKFWRELLIAAREPEETTLQSLRREAELHFCGELIHAQCAGGAPLSLIAENRMDAAQEE
ncbi:hypothetical protein [Hyphomicrobium sp.]|uniref:hypothetical protein n=1 Tax=Hyphomicrobium sp. TaxID=82 RepID=UPI0025BAB0C0|nr:hypothetical protein [Hyphomicrobium sp.]MCC7253221.1 hypothetical protein [Hyphomicrobium sp.]